MSFSWKGGEIILADPGQEGGAIVKIQLPESGKFILVDEKEGQIIAEVQIRAGYTTSLSVSAGEYVAYFLTPDNQVRRIFAKVIEGQALELGLDLFQPVTLAHSITKGGLFTKEFPKFAQPSLNHAISLGGMLRRFPLDGGGISYGAALNYRLRLRSGWQPSVRLNLSTRDDVGISTGYKTFGVQAGCGYLWDFSLLALRPEALAGVEHFSQDDQAGISRSSVGFNYLGLVGLELPLGSFFVSVEGALGGRVFQVLESGWVHRLDALAIIGLGWSWPH